MDLIALLELVIVAGLLFALVYAILQWVPLPAPFKQIAYIVLALIVVVMVFDWLRGAGGLRLPHY